ncbi:MAG: hypothetical protein JSV86_10510 [Gemmatimonadota bacterium]|nr:MAG: hypothetical protein JSV86_10510 [Gemmatimonadota bacterium]
MTDFETMTKLVLAALLEQSKRKVAEKDWAFLAKLPEIAKWLRATSVQLDDLVRRMRDAQEKAAAE